MSQLPQRARRVDMEQRLFIQKGKVMTPYCFLEFKSTSFWINIFFNRMFLLFLRDIKMTTPISSNTRLCILTRFSQPFFGYLQQLTILSNPPVNTYCITDRPLGNPVKDTLHPSPGAGINPTGCSDHMLTVPSSVLSLFPIMFLLGQEGRVHHSQEHLFGTVSVASKMFLVKKKNSEGVLDRNKDVFQMIIGLFSLCLLKWFIPLRALPNRKQKQQQQQQNVNLVNGLSRPSIK